MFKRNPDAVALVLIAGFLVFSAHRQMSGPRVPRVTVVSGQAVKARMHRTVASLKQCLHLRSTHRPAASRPL